MLFVKRPDPLLEVEKLAWEHLRRPILKSRAIRIPAPKGGEEKSFDLILSRPMRVGRPECRRTASADSSTTRAELAEQETISAHLVKALGNPRGLA
jgi:hypothetical protein